MMYLGLGLGLGSGQVVAAANGTIEITGQTIADDAAVGAAVGTLSVVGGSGSYTFTLLDDAGGLFAIDVADLEVAAALTAGSESITVEADNGVDTPLTQGFTITVSAATGGGLSTDFGDGGDIGNIGVFG